MRVRPYVGLLCYPPPLISEFDTAVSAEMAHHELAERVTFVGEL